MGSWKVAQKAYSTGLTTALLSSAAMTVESMVELKAPR
jgi:hypothetical protein